MNPQIMKMAVKMIGPENIKTAIESITDQITSRMDAIQLETGETDTVIMIWKEGANKYATICTIDNTPEMPVIKRQISTTNITILITKMLENI
jgi:hypothetical protein